MEPRTIINIRFPDANGNPGNAIRVAARIPGSSSPARNTEWWLVGNQQPVDVSLSPQVRLVEQLNPPGDRGIPSESHQHFPVGY